MTTRALAHDRRVFITTKLFAQRSKLRCATFPIAQIVVVGS
ncbi:MAG: hypothetical protein QM775_30600 [Pirellulales bacterium]